MGLPTISERKHFRIVPGQTEEPTSTIVLTSKDSHFVDVRLFRDKIIAEKDQNNNSSSCIEWAFAGKSQSVSQSGHQNGMEKLSHTVWEHWIDSKSNNPGTDEGDMWAQENGDVLEIGKMKDPKTGEEVEYEELWHHLEVVPLGKKQNRSSLVLAANDPQRNLKGLAVKIGGWCQGIFKVEDALTIERWEWKPVASRESADTEGSNVQKHTRNDWIRTFRFGEATLPCMYMCENTSGKVGLSTTLGCAADKEDRPDSVVDWKVLEEYYW